MSFVIQFQFHKSLCSIAQPNVPLYKCDVDSNKAAGEKLAQALKLGSSRPWPDVMEILTGSRHMSAKPLIEYFDPLVKYLDEQIKNETIGWKSDGLTLFISNIYIYIYISYVLICISLIFSVNQYMESPHKTGDESQESLSLISRIESLERKNEILSERITKLEDGLKQQNFILNRKSNQTVV